MAGPFGRSPTTGRRGEIKWWDKPVEAHVGAATDAGSIPAASMKGPLRRAFRVNAWERLSSHDRTGPTLRRCGAQEAGPIGSMKMMRRIWWAAYSGAFLFGAVAFFAGHHLVIGSFCVLAAAWCVFEAVKGRRADREE